MQGHEILEPQLRQAFADADAPNGARALGAILEAYVRFAREHPAHRHLMLRGELAQPDENPQALAAGQGAIELIANAVEDCQREGAAPPGDAETLVGLVWALGGGMVTLWLEGRPEGRCVSLGTTPEHLTKDIAAQLEYLLNRAGAG